jgi:hypothetical protein
VIPGPSPGTTLSHATIVADQVVAGAPVMSVVQGFDGIIGMPAHDPAKTYGPFIFALANLVALVWLLRCGTDSHCLGGSLLTNFA